MAATNPFSLVFGGPVPFKDVKGDDGVPARPLEEYNDIIAALPHDPTINFRCYQGAWFLEHRIQGIISIQRRFTLRPGDVLIASVPKSGTTWLKALAFATMARGTYTLDEHPLLRLNPHDCVPQLDEIFSCGQEAKLDALPSPRLMSTHIPYPMLPASVTDSSNCKIVYICREPKDTVVSLWHFDKVRSQLSFSDIFELTCKGISFGGPMWDHMLGYWNASKRDSKKVLFLKYEEMLQDPIHNVKRLAQFLGRPFSKAEEEVGVVADIVKLCSFEKLKSLEVNKIGSHGLFLKFPHDSYFRKGAVGDWVHHMTPEMARRLDAIILEKFHGSGLTFT